MYAIIEKTYDKLIFHLIQGKTKQMPEASIILKRCTIQKGPEKSVAHSQASVIGINVASLNFLIAWVLWLKEGIQTRSYWPLSCLQQRCFCRKNNFRRSILSCTLYSFQFVDDKMDVGLNK